MLYDIYENVIGMIEELEKHEDHGKSAGYSGLLSNRVPPTWKREKHDVSLPALLHICPADTGNSATTSVPWVVPTFRTHEKVWDARRKI